MARNLFALFLIGAFVASPTTSSWIFGGDDLFKSFEDGMKELEKEALSVRDMLGMESRTSDVSREDLEEDASPKETDASLSEESDDDDADTSGFSPFSSFPSIFRVFGGESKPWWQGENVCVNRENKEENSTKTETENTSGIFIFGTAQFSSCKQSANKYECTTITRRNGNTKTSTVTYECCQGYRRLQARNGCVKFESKPMLESASDLDAEKFASFVRSAGLEEKLDQQGLTVFAPTDAAFDNYQASMADFNQIDTQDKKGFETNKVEDMLGKPAEEKVNTRVLVLDHIVAGSPVESSDFANDMVLKTENNSTLRINIFPGKTQPLLTVNCASFNTTDRITKTGVLHTVNAVLSPVSSTVKDLLDAPKYSKFKLMLLENELYGDLDGDGPFTVMALTNKAMDNVKTSMCMKRVLKHHILPHTVCSEAARAGKISAMDLSNHWLHLSFNDDGQLLLDNAARALTTDILATNGLVHEVDSLVVPLSAKSPSEILKKTNHTRFLDLMEKAGLVDEMDTGDKLTLFVPSEKSLEDAEESLKGLSEQELRRTMLYHLSKDPRESCELSDGLKLTSLNDGQQLNVQLYNNILSGLTGLSAIATVQCVPLTRANGRTCNGMMHEISGVMTPPESSVFDYVQTHKELSLLKDVLKGTKLEEELKAGLGDQVTLLAPTDSAFEQMGEANFNTLMTDKELADQILRAHILTEPVCCSGVGVSSWPFVSTVKSLRGSTIETNRRSRRHPVTFAGVPVAKCDIIATDGIVHLLSGVMLPAGQRHNTDVIFRKPNSEIILTGF